MLQQERNAEWDFMYYLDMALPTFILESFDPLEISYYELLFYSQYYTSRDSQQANETSAPMGVGGEIVD